MDSRSWGSAASRLRKGRSSICMEKCQPPTQSFAIHPNAGIRTKSAPPGRAREGRSSLKKSFSKRKTFRLLNPWESARGSQPSRIKIDSGGVYVGVAADFCVGKSHFPEQKSLPCTICGQSFRQKTQANCGGGGSGGGAKLPRPHSLTASAAPTRCARRRR